MASPVSKEIPFFAPIEVLQATSNIEPFRVGSFQDKPISDLKSRIVNRTGQTLKGAVFKHTGNTYLTLEGRVNCFLQDMQDFEPNKVLEIVSNRMPSEEEFLEATQALGVSVESFKAVTPFAFTIQFVDLPQNRINVLILSCLGGNGHEAARRAIEEQISHTYNSHVIYPLKSLKFGCSPDFENAYNWMVRKGWNPLINRLAKLIPPLLASAKGTEERISQLVKKTIQKVQPALIISVAPIFNGIAMQVSAEHGLPYFLVTTDFNLTNWTFGLKPGQRVSYAIGPDIEETRGLLEANGATPEQIHAIGFPIREEFYEEKPSRETLCEELHLPADKPIILIMAGGSGGAYAYDIAKFLLPQPLNAHFVIIAGKNEDLRNRVKALPASISLTSLGYTNRVSDYMRVARLLPTKPGPGTLEEAAVLYRRYRTPFILLETSGCFFWEKTGIKLIEEARFGAAFTDQKDLLEKVYKHLPGEDPEVDLNNIPENRFRARIGPIIEELIEQPK